MKHLPKIHVLIVLALFLACKNGNNNKVQKEAIPVTNTKVERVEPPNWWIGFKDSGLQLLVKENGIGAASPEISCSGVSIVEVHQATSPNYLFIDLNISENTMASKFDIVFNFENGDKKTHTYELKSRQRDSESYHGFDSSDVIYLITPDRFANADPSNDIRPELKERAIDRSDDYARHGGDIAGITKNLDYISDMGFTAIWSCPLLTNDMYNASYHGYAMTDFYEIDPRFGTLEEYITLSMEAKERGVGLIIDQVANHCGVYHWWMEDLPFNDWLNYQKGFENKEKTIYSNHRRTSNQDIYASKKDNAEMADGWFTDKMPDLNQRNPFMGKYIIQNSIWWIETAGLSGIRQDTYPYPDKAFMSDWAGAIMNEYPNFSIVGEEWSLNPLLIAYWQEGAQNRDGYDSNLPSSMDFAMQSLIVQGISEDDKWNSGLVKIYEGLANDFAYPSPKDIMVFPDNHDMSRIYTQFGEDITNTKMALAYLLALPRIPQIYYGTEILMNDTAKPGDHGLIRTDFPGGWEGDAVNAFTGEGLTEAQKDMQSFLKKILNYRKSSDAIHNGKTLHFAPHNGTYVLFRILEDEVVAVILNKNSTSTTLDLNRFSEIGIQGRTLKNIVSGEAVEWGDELVIEAKGITLLTTKM